MAVETTPEVYQVHAWIRQISPMIWRRLLVRIDSTLADLHDDAQRSVIGIGLSKRATERQIPLRTVKERLDNGFRSRSRVYPRAFLEEWFKEYRAGLPGDQAGAGTRTSADNSSSSVPDSGLLAQ